MRTDLIDTSLVSAVLNIGLNSATMSQDATLSVARTLLGQRARRTAVHTSDTEPTLVVELYGDITPGAVYSLASVLGQEAIAYYNAEIGFGLLIGPQAEKWGAFDPTQFLTFSGERLEEPEFITGEGGPLGEFII